jgi:hypothetical protein
MPLIRLRYRGSCMQGITTCLMGAMFLLVHVSGLTSARASELTVIKDKAETLVRSLAAVPLQAEPLFRQTATNQVERFEAVAPTQTFDVVNSGESFLLLMFEPCTSARFSPTVVRMSPRTRQTVTMVTQPGVRSYTLNYAVACASTPFTTHMNRYRAGSDGETVLCVPVAPTFHAAMQARTESIFRESKVLVTDPRMPSATYIYTPGPFYKSAGLFARDFLYQLEGAGRSTVTADEVKRAVDYLAHKQLVENRKFGPYTYPKGAIPDHVYPDGRHCWGPGAFYGDNTAHFNRPSLDEALCFITLAWHYGFKAEWDASWRIWFKGKGSRFADAWNSVPRNARTGLVTQWTTPGHLGANGIAETHGASVMWGFHDSYGFPGDDVGTSVLACNAARALADMNDHAADPDSAGMWSLAADLMRDAIQAQFNAAGYLPWGVGAGAPSMASPDLTGYAAWSGILTDVQADAASDWLATRYHTDKAAGGAADLFHMTPGLRGAIRMARKDDDVNPGSHVWPHVPAGHWENLAYGYNAYQDGGYWYYMSLGIAATLWRKHPAEAKEWVANAYTDITTGDTNHPYERIDGLKPVNGRYNASIGPLLGMGMPAIMYSLTVSTARSAP